MNDAVLFSQLATLGSSVVLLFGITLLWRKSLQAYTAAFQWQSVVLSGLFVIIGYFGHDAELYFVAAVLFVLKVLILPRYLGRLEQRFGGEREVQPYVNVVTSLIISSLLVLLAYAITRPLVLVSELPTRGGLPLAMGLIFIGLFVVITRKKALTQIVGFLVMENGIALLAVLATYGIPLIIELGVFLDVLMGFLVMQVFVYHIHSTFESIDIDQLNQLKH
jgi:hydrogenase-4 component E